MKKTNFISGMLATLWLTGLLSFALIGVFSYGNLNNDLIYNCSGQSSHVLDENSLNYAENYSYRDSFSQMENYFYNLRQNFGYNQKGSCGYIALGMLFTYYDSYWNDNLVPESYDANAYLRDLDAYLYSSSPGSNEKSIDNESNLTDEKYMETLINSYSHNSLHAKLLSIGKSFRYGLGLTFSNIRNILDSYMQNNEQISIDDWVVTSYYNNNYKSKVPENNMTYSEMMLGIIKDYLKLGIPVLVTITDGAEKGHVVIAYDYDDENDIVYSHFGWYGGFTHMNLFSNGYRYVTGYITIGSRLQHFHSNNYIVDGVAVCSCALPNHKHEYVYKSNNSTTHAVNCYCGYSSTKNHNFKSGLGVESKYLICQDCKYMKLNSGTITPVKPGL